MVVTHFRQQLFIESIILSQQPKKRSLDEILRPITDIKGPVDVVVNYDGFDIRSGKFNKNDSNI